MAPESKSPGLRRGLVVLLLLLLAAAVYLALALRPLNGWQGHLRLAASTMATTNSYDPKLMQRVFSVIESAEFLKAVSEKAGAGRFSPGIPKPSQTRGTALIEIKLTANNEQACERLVHAAAEELSARFAGQVAFEVVDSVIVPRETHLQQVWKWLQSWLP